LFANSQLSLLYFGQLCQILVDATTCDKIFKFKL
jgi:hypothetical protein